MTTETYFSRQGDTMAITTVRLAPAVIEWQEILGCIKIESDDNCEPPWECCDGYEHYLEEAELSHNAINKRTGQDDCIYQNGRLKRIVLEYDQSLYSWYWERGASKQPTN